jgi:hypothetical protein
MTALRYSATILGGGFSLEFNDWLCSVVSFGPREYHHDLTGLIPQNKTQPSLCLANTDT